MSEHLDTLVIGGGVIGFAVARALALENYEVTLVEAESDFGLHTSSRNSEVIHAGIYYEPGSLKALTCVRGKDLLYAYCAKAGVSHRRVGKLIVATREAEISELERLRARAEANGVNDLTWLDAAEVRALEPNVSAVRGLFSPSTGIIDSHGFMAALRRDAVAAGSAFLSSTPVLEASVAADGIEVSFGGPEPAHLRCRKVVNAAGLRAQDVARSVRGLDPASIPPRYFAKGHYFAFAGPSPFNHLVYPVPVAGGLGTHVTLDLAGNTRFGPDVSYVEDIDYAFDETRAAAFGASVRSYFPSLSDAQLVPGYTGIRPKLVPSGAPAVDFLIQGPESHGVPGLVNLYGIESPGLTASLALAEHVVELIARTG